MCSLGDYFRRPTVSTQNPRLLDQVRHTLRIKHYALRTEEAYLNWIKRFILFHHKQHPQHLNSPEIEQFLTYLAVEQKVSASTQSQALSALPTLEPATS